MKGFKAFLLRGNLVQLAVAVVIGIAFNAVVLALVSDLVTPLIAAIGGQPNFGGLSFTLNHSLFHYGLFVNALVSFIVIAAVVYFLIVTPVTRVLAKTAREQEATQRECPECLSSIPIAATRCAFCTAVVPPVATQAS